MRLGFALFGCFYYNDGMDSINDISARIFDIDVEVAVILEAHTLRAPFEPAHTERELCDALIDLFGRTGATSRLRGSQVSDGTLLVSLMNAGLVRATPRLVQPQYRRIDLELTRLGHEVRTARMIRDLEVSRRVMDEMQRRAQTADDALTFGVEVYDEPAQPAVMESDEFVQPAAMESNSLVRRAMLRRMTHLLLEYQQAAREQADEDFVQTHRHEMAPMTEEHIACLEGLEGGKDLVRIIRNVQREVAHQFMNGRPDPS